ncbi:MAG TPA: class I SAM-dependent methyltransferase [Bryobacteraceae bacterium]|jgi:SAM-dependent methyltransferase
MEECGLYAEPELYDRLFPSARNCPRGGDEARRERIAASERFYLEEAQRGGGRVLELACGSGRLTIPIAKSGVEITGADLSASMLEAARRKAAAEGAAVEFVQADMRQFDLPGPFSTIVIAGNSLLHLLAAEDLKSCLANVRRHLAPGGRLVFDVANPSVGLLARDSEQRWPVLTAPDPERGEITIEEIVSYDSAAQVRHVNWFLSAPGAPDFRSIRYALRMIFPQELLLLLDAAGFRLEARYGEFLREPFGPGSPRQVCVCTTT